MRLPLAAMLLGLALPAIADQHGDDADCWYPDRSDGQQLAETGVSRTNEP